VHYSNQFGITASCADCHVPPAFVPGLLRHVKASVELWGHLTGELDTPAKYEAHRMKLASRSGRNSRRMIPPNADTVIRQTQWPWPSRLQHGQARGDLLASHASITLEQLYLHRLPQGRSARATHSVLKGPMDERGNHLDVVR